MKYIKFKDTQEWNSNIEKLAECPYTYSTLWHEFQKEYSRPYLIADESFLLLQDNVPIAVVKVFIEEDDKGNRYIGWDRGFLESPYIICTLPGNRYKKIQKEIMLKVDEIAIHYGCKRTMYKLDVLSNPDFKNYECNFNWLMQFGYLDYSSISRIIYLGKNENELKQDFRKGTKSEIKKGETLNIIIKDYSNISKQDIIECREIYEYDAGKVTRTSELLEYYYLLISQNMGLLGFAELNGKKIATMISVYYHGSAYYLLYAEKTDQANKTSPGYSLQFNMIKSLKNRNVLYYDMGEQVFGKTHYNDPDFKEINISLYKRGFGGYMVPIFRGIKEY